MIIINQKVSNEIKFIPRQGEAYSVILTDEQSKEEIVVTPTFTTQGYMTVFTLSETLTDGRRYKFIVENEIGEKLYHDLLLVTDQEINDFTLNDNQYQVDEEETTTSYKFI